MSEDKSSALYDDIVTVNSVDPALYDMYPVKRGLRNNDGSGGSRASRTSRTFMAT